LAASPSTWGWGEFSIFGNFIGLVGSYGLPVKVDALRSYVGAI
jgi:hypothetical protein